MSRKKLEVMVEKVPAPETLSLFAPGEVAARGEKPMEERDNAPPDAEDKIRMAKQRHVDDGRPARRRLDTLKGYRLEESAQHGKARVPVRVSIFCMDTRTYWRRVEDLAVANPMMELERSEPEAPPLGTQWTDATSSETER